MTGYKISTIDYEIPFLLVKSFRKSSLDAHLWLFRKMHLNSTRWLRLLYLFADWEYEFLGYLEWELPILIQNNYFKFCILLDHIFRPFASWRFTRPVDWVFDGAYYQRLDQNWTNARLTSARMSSIDLYQWVYSFFIVNAESSSILGCKGLSDCFSHDHLQLHNLFRLLLDNYDNPSPRRSCNHWRISGVPSGLFLQLGCYPTKDFDLFFSLQRI